MALLLHIFFMYIHCMLLLVYGTWGNIVYNILVSFVCLFWSYRLHLWFTQIIWKHSSSSVNAISVNACAHNRTGRVCCEKPVSGPAQPTGINLFLDVITSSTAHLWPPKRIKHLEIYLRFMEGWMKRINWHVNCVKLGNSMIGQLI